METSMLNYFLLLIFSVTSLSLASNPHVIINGSTDELYNHTAISEFRLLNRRFLGNCPDPNPYLSINVSADSQLPDQGNVTVTVSGVLIPDKSDWVAMISPANTDITDCPTATFMYKQTGDFSSLPLLCHYPVKAQFVSNDPSYLGCEKSECQATTGDYCGVRTCSGSITFHFVNIRTPLEFVFFTNGLDAPCILKRSDPIKFANPNRPLHAHLSSVDSTGTKPGSRSVVNAMADEVASGSVDSIFHIGDISYSTGFLVEWDFFLNQITPVASRVPYMTAIGNHERDYADSGSVYVTPDSGGECGVAYESYFQMPTVTKDKPWYSIELASVHFTIISTEQAWDEKSEQYGWIKNDLATVDRTKTPWVIFMGHRPMYSTLGADTNFVNSVEPLLMDNEVDLAFFGHVHNNERTCAVYQNECKAMPTKDKDGIDTYNNQNYSAPVHAIIGMAGFTLDQFPSDAASWSLSRIAEFGFARVHATKDNLMVEFVNSSTKQVHDNFHITKGGN